MSALTWIGVACLGGIGAVARFLIDTWISRRSGGRFPYGTFVINISGAFTLGLLTGLALGGDALLLAGTATVGAYTTFSTWMLETHRLAEGAEFSRALANLTVSLGVGFGAVALGHLIGAAL
ncbi:fluoride efflux transporter CrcB [Conexibacter sp. DBS9H8]|uniref:fluoride efflux transporter CrcB n=1 Tax=Conexibacter sp. DBS9H8 TaxID=2937801 RepID=UPI00200C39A8|nr:fluoride efflux transporter CrcB [Conexibacter sp. DBS9H8]